MWEVITNCGAAFEGDSIYEYDLLPGKEPGCCKLPPYCKLACDAQCASDPSLTVYEKGSDCSLFSRGADGNCIHQTMIRLG